jgi:hypothetical protein
MTKPAVSKPLSDRSPVLPGAPYPSAGGEFLIRAEHSGRRYAGSPIRPCTWARSVDESAAKSARNSPVLLLSMLVLASGDTTRVCLGSKSIRHLSAEGSGWDKKGEGHLLCRLVRIGGQLDLHPTEGAVTLDAWFWLASAPPVRRRSDRRSWAILEGVVHRSAVEILCVTRLLVYRRLGFVSRETAHSIPDLCPSEASSAMEAARA